MSFFNPRSVPKTGIRWNQKLLFSAAMRQALLVMQMPLLDLAEWLQTEIEQNPALELREKEFNSKNNYLTNSPFQEQFAKPLSLYESLIHQASLTFRGEELALAHSLIGNLDEKGFLSREILLAYPEEKREHVVRIIQSFDPPGVAAFDLRHSLLIQLHRQGKEESLAFELINHHFDDLIHHRLSTLSKLIKRPKRQIQEAIKKDLCSLNLQPSSCFDLQQTEFLIPDILITNEEGKWSVEINRDPLPVFGLSASFTQPLGLFSAEEKEMVRGFVASGKWLMRTLSKRHETLKKIAYFLLKKRESYFNGEEDSWAPLPMKELSIALGMHESTLARALYKKNLFCPRGLFPFKYFFTSREKVISRQGIQELLLQLIEKENKARPLSDQELADKIAAVHIPCSRRTVTKYRKGLNIPSSNHRKRFPS